VHTAEDVLFLVPARKGKSHAQIKRDDKHDEIYWM
jgi:hypothetical protein